MRLKGIIFDMDGTLLDSMGMWETVGDAFLSSKGITPPPSLWEKIKATTLEKTAVYFIEEFGFSNSVEEIVSQINACVEYKYFNEIMFKPTALSFIQKVNRAGIRMCVATATDRHLVEAALRRLGVLEYFCGIVTCAEVGVGKEQPRIYERALELLNTNKEETILFEDALHAIETAKKAGFYVVGVQDTSTVGEWEQIKRAADRVIYSFEEMELM